MKKSVFMFLSLTTSLILTSCNQTRSSTSSDPISSESSGTTESTSQTSQQESSFTSTTSSSQENVDFDEQYEALCSTNLSMTTDYSVEVIDYAEDSFEGEADCIFNEGAYSVSNPGPEGEDIDYTYTFFSEKYTYEGKEYDMAFQHYIDKDNKVQSEIYVDSSYYIYEFAAFTNQFSENYIDLFSEDEEGVFSLDTTANDGLELAQYFVFLSTGYYPDGFEYFNLVSDGERITSISYQTTQYEDSYFSDIVFTGVATIDDVARTVKDVEPYEERTYTQTLLSACNNFEDNALSSEVIKTAKDGVESDDSAMHIKISWNENVLYLHDFDEEYSYETGYVVKDGNVRELVVNSDSTYSYNPYDDIYEYDADYNMVVMTSLDSYLPIRNIPVQAFEYDETNDEYYLTGDNAYYFFALYNYSYYTLDSYNIDNQVNKLTMKLDDSKENIVEMDLDTTNYTYAVSYTTYSVPFDFDTLTKYDPSPKFNGTYTGTCETLGEGTITIVINNVENGERSLTINGTSYECEYSNGNFYFTFNNVQYYFVTTYDGGIALYQPASEDEEYDTYIQEFETISSSSEEA